MNLESIRLDGFTEGEYIGFWFDDVDWGNMLWLMEEEDIEFVKEGGKGEWGC